MREMERLEQQVQEDRKVERRRLSKERRERAGETSRADESMAPRGEERRHRHRKQEKACQEVIRTLTTSYLPQLPVPFYIGKKPKQTPRETQEETSSDATIPAQDAGPMDEESTPAPAEPVELDTEDVSDAPLDEDQPSTSRAEPSRAKLSKKKRAPRTPAMPRVKLCVTGRNLKEQLTDLQQQGPGMEIREPVTTHQGMASRQRGRGRTVAVRGGMLTSISFNREQEPESTPTAGPSTAATTSAIPRSASTTALDTRDLRYKLSRPRSPPGDRGKKRSDKKKGQSRSDSCVRK